MRGQGSGFTLVMPFVLLATNTVFADESRFEVTPLVGITTGGGFEQTFTPADIDDGTSFAIALNMQASVNTQYELLYSRQNNQLQSGGLFNGLSVFDLDIEYLQIGGTYLFDGKGLQPYIVATLGVSRFTPEPSDLDSETFLAFSGGGGLKYRINDSLGIRLEARGFSSFVKDETNIFCQTGADANVCVVTAEGDLVTQWSIGLGLAFRF